MRGVTTHDATHDRWLLLLLTHHLFLDHISMEIVVHELRTLMEDPAAVLPQPIPYRNFVAHTLADPQTPAHLEFFNRILSDVTSPTTPFGLHALPASPSQAPRGETIREGRLRLSQELSDKFRSRAAIIGVSSASLFHLAWALVLGHISASRDVVFGTVLLGRMNSGAQAAHAVGMFINTLPLRVSLDATAVTAALATHRLLQQLQLHEHAPLALVQRASGISAPLPLITSLFNFRHSPDTTAAAPWDGVSMLFAQERTNYPAAMAVDDTSKAFHFTATTAPMIDPDLLCRMLNQTVVNLLRQLESTPDTPLSQLPKLEPITRIAMEDALFVAPKPVEFEGPRTPSEIALQAIWQRLLGLRDIGIHENFFNIGGDSLTAMRLLSAIGSTLHVDLPMRALLDAPSIAGLAANLMTPAPHQAQGAGVLVSLQPKGTRSPIFCIHPAGGYVFCYLPLARELSQLLHDDVPLYGYQAKGLEDNGPLPNSIEEAAAQAIEALRKQQADGPYQLLGMSSGGLIAFEMARQLRAAGQFVGLLAMLDTAVPSPDRGPLQAQSLLRSMAAELGCLDLLSKNPAPDTLAELVAAAQGANRLPESFTLLHAERLARVFANSVVIHERYKPKPTAERLLLLRATLRLHPADMPPDWSAYIPHDSQIVDFDTDHAGLVSRLLAPGIARVIAPLLAS